MSLSHISGHDEHSQTNNSSPTIFWLGRVNFKWVQYMSAPLLKNYSLSQQLIVQLFPAFISLRAYDFQNVFGRPTVIQKSSII